MFTDLDLVAMFRSSGWRHGARAAAPQLQLGAEQELVLTADSAMAAIAAVLFQGVLVVRQELPVVKADRIHGSPSAHGQVWIRDLYSRTLAGIDT